MRRAYVGLSTPLAYDHRNRHRIGPTLPEDVRYRYSGVPFPNPILESPYGLILLYDEIWFLSRSVCPYDMRDLPYVHFIYETDHVEDIYHKFADYNADSVRGICDIDNGYFELTQSNADVREAAFSLPITWDATIVENSEIIGTSLTAFGSSGKIESVLIDLVYLSHLRIPDLELITNRFTTPIVDRLYAGTSPEPQLAATNLATAADQLWLEHIPNYLSKDGPYHECLEEARADPFIDDFRNWLGSQPPLQDLNEVAEMVRVANDAFRRLEHDLFMKHLSRKSTYVGVGKAVGYAVLDLLAGGVGTGASALDAALSGRKAEKLRWQGFLANQRFQHHKDS
ncbi:MAG: hypothetical protein AAF546_13460 [Verrucomicrobiota bacterium]